MKRILSVLLLLLLVFCQQKAMAQAVPAAEDHETWESLDKQIKGRVYQLNVGLKLLYDGGLWANLADLSPKYHYPVFTSSHEDKGYRVVGFGTAFPITTPETDRTYFITNRHVVNAPDQIIEECRRFFAALRLYSEQTAGSLDTPSRLRQIVDVINLAGKKDMSGAERALYQETCDAIWDTYDTYLSEKADPQRQKFHSYVDAVGLSPDVAYFLHAPGPISQKPLQADLYKLAKSDSEPDLAILTVDDTSITGLAPETAEPAEGQEIQVIGYPTASDQIDLDSSQYYAPTFSTGRISRVGPRILEVDAPITTGNSGGPVVNKKGKLLGIVTLRALSSRGGELPNFAGAINLATVRAFAPELFTSPTLPY